MAAAPWLGWVLAAAAGLTPVTDGAAAVYRCEVGGKVVYTDWPCAGGRQTAIALPDPTVPASERAAAEVRAAADRAALADIDRRRTDERLADQRAAALSARRGTDRSTHVQACNKLARAVRRAHDDFAIAGPSAQPRARLRMQHADEDYLALCKPPR